MITEKQAKIMAQQYCEENQANLFVYHGFVAGVDAALNVLLPEINAKRAESARLRAALSSVVTDILDAARIVNDGKVPAYWKSTLEAAQAALNNTEK